MEVWVMKGLHQLVVLGTFKGDVQGTFGYRSARPHMMIDNTLRRVSSYDQHDHDEYTYHRDRFMMMMMMMRHEILFGSHNLLQSLHSIVTKFSSDTPENTTHARSLFVPCLEIMHRGIYL